MSIRNLVFVFIFVAVASCSLFTLTRSNAEAQEAPKSITLTVEPADLSLLSEALSALPFGRVAPLMNKLQSQVIAQQTKPAAADAHSNKAEPKK